MKAKQTKGNTVTAVSLLLQAAQSGMASWQVTLQAMRLRVTEPDCVTALKALPTGAEKQKALTAWARTALKDMPSAFSTISGYIRRSASAALVPNAIGHVVDGVGENAPTREVTIDTIKTRRELTALAVAANKKLGIKKKEGSGSTEKAETAEQKAEKQAAVAIENAVKHAKANEKLAIEADKGASQTIVALIRKAFDGQHPHMEQAVRDGLHAIGYKLTMVVLDTKHGGKPLAKPATVKGKRAKADTQTTA